MDTPQTLIFSDLDGTLLDHDSYSAEPALQSLALLEKAGIPVILNTSKTAAEILQVRRQLQNRHPFIAENGAAVYIPEQYFTNSIPELQTCMLEGYQCIGLCEPRQYWQDLINDVPGNLAEKFTSFTKLEPEGIAELTGLDLEQARLANQRDFSEPLYWQGNDKEKQQLIQSLEQKGANILEGGRFLHVSGQVNKGISMCLVADIYQQNINKPVYCIAAGDSPNDSDMLNMSDQAIVIKSGKSELIPASHDKFYYSTQKGPRGWSEAISELVLETL